MTYQQHLNKYKLSKLPYERRLEKYTKKIQQVNELCGDGLIFYFFIENGVVQDVGFDGYGCFLSRLSASFLAKKIVGKSVGVLQSIDEKKVLSLLGFPISSSREGCVLTPLRVFKSLLQEKTI